MNKTHDIPNDLYQVTRRLAAVAAGREPAETVIKNAALVNVNTGEILPGTDVAAACGRVALVGDASHTVGEGTLVYDAAGAYLTPGFLDGHMHVESGMMTIGEYANAVIPHGTTAVFHDPHEIANVLGAKGVDLMLEGGKGLPLRCFLTMPSCVPAVPRFDDTGAAFSPEIIAEYLDKDGVCGLGEMMNYPGIIGGEDAAHAAVAETLKRGKTVTGHYPISDLRDMNAYISAGISCCHETTLAADALAKMRLGMYVQIREGSAWHDLKELSKAITETRADTRFACLVSDDAHPQTLITRGHMDHIIRRAIECGINPITAIQMATINTAACFGMQRDLGSVSPGKLADMLILSDLEEVRVEKVFANGRLAAENGRMLSPIPRAEIPDYAKHTMNIPRPLTEADFIIQAPAGAVKSDGTVTARVIEVIELRVGTYERHIPMHVINGAVPADPALDVCALAVVERHKNTGLIGRGFVKGFGIKTGAVASTVAHDAHNLMVVGTNARDMAAAANALREAGGGMAAVRDGAVIALLELPIAGLMCEHDARTVAARVATLDAAWKTLGCALGSPFMTMALLALPVIPELRLTARGLVDVTAFEAVGLFLVS